MRALRARPWVAGRVKNHIVSDKRICLRGAVRCGPGNWAGKDFASPGKVAGLVAERRNQLLCNFPGLLRAKTVAPHRPDPRLLHLANAGMSAAADLMFYTI